MEIRPSTYRLCLVIEKTSILYAYLYKISVSDLIYKKIFTEATAQLLAHNAPVKVKNCDGWNPLMEAVSYGDRQIITEMLRKLKAQSRTGFSSRKSHLVKMLEDIDDFYLELKWDFQSWIPLLSRMLPSDVCQIYKKGTQLRMDTTLADFNERRWERGDISFVFNADAHHEGDELIIMDNNSKVFQRVRHEESEAEVDEEVDVLMSSDIVSAQISTKTITFRQAFSGWIFKHAREQMFQQEQIGDYNVNFFLVEGMKLVSRKRREHLTADDIKRNKSFMQSLASGAAVCDDDFKSFQHRKSLAPPGRMPTTWEEYVGAAPGAAPPLGRAQVLKQNEKHLTALIGMSEEFPMSIEVLLNILEIVAPFKHLDKLRRFCEARLPPGFPVRIEIPLLPTISAKVTFQKLQLGINLSDKIFLVPTSYREDPTRFPDL
ncbi:ankyrin repeat domain-containing protein 13C-A family protein [Dictyocaulus viviparus]|uniref:Ankyrin repeat domain-containing protein 13C-A family protein n=1 Tax=Dictyocaulus viviparus TaxID=29172 RepID=A0A0D8XTC2_DICVI|nr:ankyrin repeat domain-containing protein 13C-A family protein [Dictyocaulus viviparus]